MLTLITGQPGNGKSLMAMDRMRNEYERNRRAVLDGKEEPRRFFSNIAGASTEENPAAFPWIERLPEHNDWTKLPAGSYVQLDEAHADGVTPGLERYGLLFPSTGKPGESADHRIKALSTHRHGGYDIDLITQWPSKVHHQARSLVGEHIHMNRALGLERAGVLKWTRVQSDPYDERQREKAEEQIWAFPKDLYGKYRSATLHTASHKFRIPKKFYGILCMLLVAGVLLWFFAGYIKDKAATVKQAGQAESAASGQGRSPTAAALGFAETDSSGQPIRATPAVSSVASSENASSQVNRSERPIYDNEPRACMVANDRCRCWDAHGLRIIVNRSKCVRWAAEGFPRIDMIGTVSGARQLQEVVPTSMSTSSVSIVATDGVGSGRVAESKLAPIGGI
jgi:Zonular occludens toxin (Zot).